MIFEQALEPGHPKIITCLENYARLLRKTNRMPEALELEARARGAAREQSHRGDKGVSGINPAPLCPKEAGNV